MKRWISSLALALVLGAGAAQAAPLHVFPGIGISIHVGGPIHGVRRGHGRLHIEVSPERAKVYVDGRYKGRGDQNLVLRAGAHRVKVVLGDGREVESETVHIRAGELTRAHLDL